MTFCGVPYGNYDLKRLQEGLCVVKDRKTGKKSFAILRKAITAFEDFLFSRFQMHVQIYTHKIDAACNKAFEEMAKQSDYTLPPTVDKYIEIDDENFLNQKPELEKNLSKMIRDQSSGQWRFKATAMIEPTKPRSLKSSLAWIPMLVF